MSSNISISKICECCNSSFVAKKTVTKYCSHRCASRAYKQRIRDGKVEKANNKTVFSITHKIEEIKSKQYLSIKELCVLMGISRSTVNRLIKNKTIPFVKFGKRIIIDKSDIEKILGQSRMNNMGLGEQIKISDYYNIQDIEDCFGMKYSRLNEVVKKHSIPKVVREGKVLFSKTHIDEYFKSNRKDVSHISEWYTVKEIQDKYSLTRDQVYNRVHDYQIPKKKEGKFSKISKYDFDVLFSNL